MLIIDNNCTNPYMNLATEEYILKNFSQDIFMLWRDEPCIVVGKNQNTLSEINIDYIEKNSIPVVRRLTGGGAVFHDLGNLNFTFISNKAKDDFNDFQKFTKPILDFLATIFITAEFSGRNDLTIEGKKFSGNAQCNYKERVMHHGTLLFSSEIKDLSNGLKVNPAKFQGKGVKSVASRVTNISAHLKKPMDVIEFKKLLMDYVVSSSTNNLFYEFTENDLKAIKKLCDEKYSTWQWNFGNSPKYDFQNHINYPNGNIEFNLCVKNGIISDIKIYGDFFSKSDICILEEKLRGVPHCKESIVESLLDINLQDFFSGITPDIFFQGLF